MIQARSPSTQGHENTKFKASLSHLVRPCLKEDLSLMIEFFCVSLIFVGKWLALASEATCLWVVLFVALNLLQCRHKRYSTSLLHTSLVDVNNVDTRVEQPQQGEQSRGCEKQAGSWAFPSPPQLVPGGKLAHWGLLLPPGVSQA